MKERFEFEVNGLNIRAEFFRADIENVFLPLLDLLTKMQRDKGRRIAVFLAAPPAAGKSTLCCLLEKLSRGLPGLTPVQCVGIDGFHYPQAYLDSHSIVRHGESIPLARIKGAPESYDVQKLRRLLENLNAEGQRWPKYDRRIHDPVEEAVEICEDILIVEGNWLLLNEPPWNELGCDFSIFLRMGDRSQLERIVQRKMMGGYDEATARDFVENNDWPNIQRCMQNSRGGNWTVVINESGFMEVIK